MPICIYKDCGYEARDKYALERHLNRVYPCKIVIIGSKEKIEVKKIKEITEDEIVEDKPLTEVKYKMKTNVISGGKNKLEKE